MTGFYQTDNKLIFRQKEEILQIEPWGKDSLRVRATQNRSICDDLPGTLLPAEKTKAKINLFERTASIQNGALRADVHLKGDIEGQRAEIHFLSALNGDEILAEPSSHFPRFPSRYFRFAGGDYSKLEQRFQAYEGEKIYGLGQHQHGRLDQKGMVIDLAQVNTEVCIPFILSSRGYGFLWHNPAVGRVEFGVNETRWVAEATYQLDYWITTGKNPTVIMEHYAAAVGSTPMMPEWAAGFWQCKLRYRNQEELLEVAREYHRRGLPLSVIVIDFFHWSKQGDWQFDSSCWPDPKSMVQELEEMGVKVMVSIWPTVNVVSKNFPEMQERDLLVRTERGVQATMDLVDTGQEGTMYGHFYDPTNPEAREFIWEQVREGYYKHGIKVFWLDACEPEIKPRHFDNLRYHIGNGSVVTNLYPYYHAQAFYDGMRSEGETEIINLSRSAWAGSQRFGAALWSGDIQSTFEALRAQIPAGLNAAVSGIPWWTTDIGGFFNGDIHSPYFRELIVRWFQYGLFCPLFRLHGFRLPYPEVEDGIFAGGPNEVWSFGNEAYEIIRDLMFLRERLKPYILSQMKLAHERGTPPMRPLFFDFPEDELSWKIEDELMFGPNLLVAPVYLLGARSRLVYLPPSTTWRDAWTDTVYEGNQTIEVDAPLDRIPLYLRGGAHLPIKE